MVFQILNLLFEFKNSFLKSLFFDIQKLIFKSWKLLFEYEIYEGVAIQFSPIKFLY
jgi:hypothetical protein